MGMGSVFKSFVVCLFLINSAHAVGPFTIKNVENILNARNYTKIEDVLRTFPAEQRSSYTLVHSTNSLQGADAKNPRVIMYGPDATFIVAFNGNPNYSGYDKLEMIQFDRPTAKFRFFDTYRDSNNAIKVQEQTTNCTTCHETDLRPNWQPYAEWPGTYGSIDDALQARESPKDEITNLKEFLKTAESHPRYSVLVDLVDGYKLPGTMRTKQLHNTNFTFRIYNLNMLRMVRMLQETPGYDKYKYAILGSAMCHFIFDSFFPAGMLPKVKSWNRFSRYEPVDGTPAFFTLMDIWGVNWSSYSMMFHLVNSKPFNGEVFNTSSSPAQEFAGPLVDADPDLQMYASRFNYTTGGVTARWADVHSCDTLAKKSKAALTP